MPNFAALKKFVLAEMKQRDMSAREFADMVGVGHTTINRLLDERNDSVPSMELFVKMADATHIDLADLLTIAFPEVMNKKPLDADASVFLEHYKRAPKHIRDAIDLLVVSAGRQEEK